MHAKGKNLVTVNPVPLLCVKVDAPCHSSHFICSTVNTTGDPARHWLTSLHHVTLALGLKLPYDDLGSSKENCCHLTIAGHRFMHTGNRRLFIFCVFLSFPKCQLNYLRSDTGKQTQSSTEGFWDISTDKRIHLATFTQIQTSRLPLLVRGHRIRSPLWKSDPLPGSSRPRSSRAPWTQWSPWLSPALWRKGNATCCAPPLCAPQTSPFCCQTCPSPNL